MSESEYWEQEALIANAGLENGDVWITKDGKRILIKDLTDEHLINIVKFLRKNVKKYRVDYREKSRCFGEEHYKHIESLSDEDFLVETIDTYDNLVRELKKRKLEVENE